MAQIILSDKSTHPPVGSLLWDSQDNAWEVARRYRKRGSQWLTLELLDDLFTSIDLPLARVTTMSRFPRTPEGLARFLSPFDDDDYGDDDDDSQDFSAPDWD